ncbi:MAG TPA: hypothetical protein VM618_06380, partial [Acidimicrobiia bacterium]|nr:hypothetical protein [Acidimicrobiia bacterium]
MVVAVVGPPTSAQENPDAGRPTYWEAKTFARAVQFQVNTNPLLIPFQDLVRLDFAEGDGNWSAFGEARGRASALWPGDAVSKGPAAFCANGLPCPDGFPPAWPLSVTAEGSQADATMEGGQTFGDGPFTGKAMEARAHAARDYVETVATYQGLSIADTGGISKQVAENVAGPLRQVARELDAGVRQASGELDGAFRQLIAPFAEGGLPVLISPSFAVGGVIPGFEKALTF